MVANTGFVRRHDLRVRCGPGKPGGSRLLADRMAAGQARIGYLDCRAGEPNVPPLKYVYTRQLNDTHANSTLARYLLPRHLRRHKHGPNLGPDLHRSLYPREHLRPKSCPMDRQRRPSILRAPSASPTKRPPEKERGWSQRAECPTPESKHHPIPAEGGLDESGDGTEVLYLVGGVEGAAGVDVSLRAFGVWPGGIVRFVF